MATKHDASPRSGSEAPAEVEIGMRGQRDIGPALGLALLGAMTLGAYLRWVLAGKLPLDWDFAHLRHAHSHLGYYGLLFPLAWLGWRRAGVALPGPRVLLIYGLANAVAFLGFGRAGYGPEAIVGSTVVAAIWLWTSWRLRERWRDLGDPLAGVLPGVIAAEACVPFIAYFLDRDEALAYGLVTMFLTLLLLAVIVPSALSALGLRVSWLALLTTALLSAAALGPWHVLPTRLGLAAYALLLAWTILTPRGRVGSSSSDSIRNLTIGPDSDSCDSTSTTHLRAVWTVLTLGMLGMATGWLPNTRPVVIGAIHFLVLSPVLGSLMPLWLRRDLPVWAWWVYHGFVVLLAAPLAAIGLGLGAGARMLNASALGGTLVLLWWLLALAFQSRS